MTNRILPINTKYLEKTEFLSISYQVFTESQKQQVYLNFKNKNTNLNVPLSEKPYTTQSFLNYNGKSNQVNIPMINKVVDRVVELVPFFSSKHEVCFGFRYYVFKVNEESATISISVVGNDRPGRSARSDIVLGTDLTHQ